MIEVSAVQFIQNPAHIQALATKEPVIVDNGKHKQVLMNYDDYQALTKKWAQISLHSVRMMLICKSCRIIVMKN